MAPVSGQGLAGFRPPVRPAVRSAGVSGCPTGKPAAPGTWDRPDRRWGPGARGGAGQPAQPAAPGRRARGQAGAPLASPRCPAHRQTGRGPGARRRCARRRQEPRRGPAWSAGVRPRWCQPDRRSRRRRASRTRRSHRRRRTRTAAEPRGAAGPAGTGADRRAGGVGRPAARRRADPARSQPNRAEPAGAGPRPMDVPTVAGGGSDRRRRGSGSRARRQAAGLPGLRRAGAIPPDRPYDGRGRPAAPRCSRSGS